MPTGLIQRPNSVKTVPNSVKTVPTVPYPVPPFHHTGELHQKDLRIIPIFLYIWGTVSGHVLEPGHLSRLKSNRPLFSVPTLINRTTCHHSLPTAVSKSH